ncbi:Hsp70 family protein [Symbioplanes lichenis]|uniref:Hsp70 family protein n=1 Tax=Symbioplanes lichenis TaxID=1629072 RepID=UPI002739196F|nr:Hsp70 family protein [Actinoplanes lichenis]
MTGTQRLAYGLDFGMSTCSLALALDEGDPRLITDPLGGEMLIPTAVAYRDGMRETDAGAAALNAAGIRPELFVDRFKRQIGISDRIFVGRNDVALVEVVSIMLRFLRDSAQRAVPAAPAQVVLTCPASWRADQREILKQAAARAGFARQHLTLIDEPTAAFEYARTLPGVDDRRPLLVYDLGGSTFDCALLVPDDGTGRPQLFRKGLADVGGTDFDEQIFNDLLSRYPEILPQLEGDAGAVRRLRRSCEGIKRRLSNDAVVHERLTELPTQPVVTVHRDTFERMVGHQISRTIEVCRSLLDDAAISPQQLGAVLPVGGSSHIPLVRSRLNELVPGAVVDVPAPEFAVVLGAVAIAQDRQYTDSSRHESSPEVFAEPADDRPAKIVGVPAAPGRPGKSGLITTWFFLLLWSSALVGLAVLHWVPAVIAAAIASALAAAAGLVHQTPRPRSAGWVFYTAAVLGGMILPVGAAVVHGYRGEWSLTAWSAGILVGAVISCISLVLATEDWEGFEARRQDFERQTSAANRVRRQRWFGTGEPPAFLERLLTIPAVRIFELSTASDGFQYAVSSGSLVLLVHMAPSLQARPAMAAAVKPWTVSLAKAEVAGFIVFDSTRVPRLSEQTRARLGAQPVTTRTFADVVGNWLAEQETIDIRTVAHLLAESDRRATRGRVPASRLHTLTYPNDRLTR